jgi:hypothetical protein
MQKRLKIDYDNLVHVYLQGLNLRNKASSVMPGLCALFFCVQIILLRVWKTFFYKGGMGSDNT